MARKERNNVDYFPHGVNHGRKMFYIRSKYKNDGYTVWFMLMEELGKSEYHYLDLKEDIQKMYLSSEFMVSEQTLISIIEDLVKLGEFDKELWESESILYNQKFVDSVHDAYKKRNNSCIDKKTLLLLLSSKGRSLSNKCIPKQTKSISKGGDNPQRIGKDSIEEYIYDSFYDEQIKKSEQDELYLMFVKILFGENDDKKKLTGVLSIEEQLTFEQFLSCYALANAKGKKISEILLKMNNDKKYYKNKVSLNRTLKNWINDTFKK
jgi:hypothetical protein